MRLPPRDPPGIPALRRVRSSTIYAISYDQERKYLYVKFRFDGGSSKPSPGMVYRYLGVPSNTWRGLESASSVGSYFAKHIRERFAYAKWTGATWRGQTALQNDSARRANARKLATLKRLARKGG